MPIYYAGKSFPKFRKLVAYLQRTKGWSKEKASAYTAGVERRQSKPVRYRGR